MNNIINSYELDFIQDIPLEMQNLEIGYHQVKSSYLTLKICFWVLVLFCVGYWIYNFRVNKKMEKEKIEM